MRVLSIVVLLLAVSVQTATIYEALIASKQFTGIVKEIDRVPQLRNILSDPFVQVTFFAPSDNALKNAPYKKPFRYLIPGVVDVSQMKEGSRYNYRGERLAFEIDKSHFNMRTEYVSLPGTDKKFQPRILRAPLRKEHGLLENGNLYYIDRLIYSCGELTMAQCQATTDDQCKGKCNERYARVPGSNVIAGYVDLSTQFKPEKAEQQVVNAAAPATAAEPAAAPATAAKPTAAEIAQFEADYYGR